MYYRKLFSAGGLIMAAAAFLLLNLAAGPVLRSVRLDLTEDNLHTLSQGTRNILKNLQEPLTLELYWTRDAAEDLPGVSLFARRIREFLEEYTAIADGRIDLRIIDPKPFSEEEDSAMAHGLQGVPVQQSGRNLYLGLVGTAPDGRSEAIPFLQPDRESFLEYDVSQLVYSLAHPRRTRVGLLSALPLAGGPDTANPFRQSPPWMILEQLHRQFDLSLIRDEDPLIPEDLDVLMVVKPGDLSDQALYAVDQFVLGGGRALVFIDPLSESSPPRRREEPAGENSRDSLLAVWGVKMEPGKVVGDIEISQRVSYRDRNRLQVVNYLPWLAVRGDLLADNEIITGQLNQVNLASAGSLLPVEGAAVDVLPLMTSSSRAMLIDRDKLASTPDPVRLMSEFTESGTVYNLAVRITGPAHTAFTEGRPADEEGEEVQTSGEHLQSSLGPINLIVVADTDLLQDRFWVDVQNFFGQRIVLPTADNADLVVNALDQMGGSPDLIAVRSRQSAFRPFDLVDRVAQRAELEYRAKEQELIDRLDTAEAKLAELQRLREDPQSPELTPDQEKELAAFREERVRTRKELRAVRFELNRDIERLEGWLKFVNIGLIPLILVLAALGTRTLTRRRSRLQAP